MNKLIGERDEMYVWEVRVRVQYEGNSWSALIKDDEKSLDKIKAEVLKLYDIFCYYEDIKREQVGIVSKVDFLEDFQSFKLGIDSKIEVEKVKVN